MNTHRKSLFFIFFLLLLSSLVFAAKIDNLYGDCTVRASNSCNAGETKVAAFTSMDNAHISLYNYNHGYSLCCPGSGSMTCSSPYAFSITSDSNAHAYPLSAGSVDVCYSIFASCSSKASCDPTTEVGVISFTSAGNAHVGLFSSYSTKVCCTVKNENCANTIDDDGDGKVDGADNECCKANGLECTYGNECCSDYCVEGYCRASCSGYYGTDMCSYNSDTSYLTYGACSQSSVSCDPDEMSLASSIYYDDCFRSSLQYVTSSVACDDDVSGGYIVNGICAHTNHVFPAANKNDINCITGEVGLDSDYYFREDCYNAYNGGSAQRACDNYLTDGSFNPIGICVLDSSTTNSVGNTNCDTTEVAWDTTNNMYRSDCAYAYSSGGSTARQCDTSISAGVYSADGICAYDTTTSATTANVNCDTDEVAYDGSRYRTDCEHAYDSGPTYRQCDNSVSGGVYSANGICTADTDWCDTDSICYDDSIYKGNLDNCKDKAPCDKNVNLPLPAARYVPDGIVCSGVCVGNALSNCCVDGDCDPEDYCNPQYECTQRVCGDCEKVENHVCVADATKDEDGSCNNLVQNGCTSGTANDAAVADTNYFRWICIGVCEGKWSSTCQICKSATETCSGGVDDDCDGTIDCADSDCQSGLQNSCDNTYSSGCTRTVSAGFNSCNLASNIACSTESNCGDSIDNDCDGNTDCADSDCQSGLQNSCDNTYSSGCTYTVGASYNSCNLASNSVCGTEFNCGDSINNDCDANTDCADTDCQTGLQNNCDTTYSSGCSHSVAAGLNQCDLSSNIACGVESSCSDNIDNNCNSFIDCQDSSCPASPSNSCYSSSCSAVTYDWSYSLVCTGATCALGSPDYCSSCTHCGDSSVNCGEACDDGNTNNGDGCSSTCTIEASSEVCSGGADEDLDGDIDCADTDCQTGQQNSCDNTYSSGCSRTVSAGFNSCNLASNIACSTESNCADSIDNDCDGSTDCADSDCQSGLQNSCDNTYSSGCTYTVGASYNSCNLASNSVCGTEFNCGDSINNDCDANTDCADTDCQTGLQNNCDTTYSSGCSHSVAAGLNQCDLSSNIACGVESSCSDNIDNNCNSFIDCQDSSCPASPSNSCYSSSCSAVTYDWSYSLVCTGATCALGSPDYCSSCTHCGDSSVNCGEACDDGNTNNGDGCSSTCTLEAGSEICSGGVDEDLDGAIDCADTDCQTGLQNNCDTTYSSGCSHSVAAGLNQCDLSSNIACGVESSCSDNIDNNCNSFIDCQDSSCPASPSNTCYSSSCSAVTYDWSYSLVCTGATCALGSPDYCSSCTHCGDSSVNCGEACDDGNTNNGDGCSSTCTLEAGAEICSGGVDEDLDGAIDCADIDCQTGKQNSCDNTYSSGCAASVPAGFNSCNLAANVACNTELNCNDAIDNDCDGLLNCADSDCSASPSCSGVEICNNIDDNGNGVIDEGLSRACSISNGFGTCSGTETCSAGSWIGCTAQTPAAEICNDGIDNDCDGLNNCEDLSDCSSDPSCIFAPSGICVSICSHVFCCELGMDGICPVDYTPDPSDVCDPCDTDCCPPTDPNCCGNTNPSAKIFGTIRDAESNDPIEGAFATLVNPSNRYSDTTDDTGYYEKDQIMASGLGTPYTLIASAVGYETKFVEVTLFANSVLETNFLLVPTNSDCRQDCTRKYNVCDKTCHGLNDCWFESSTTMNLCDPGDGLLDGHTTDHIVVDPSSGKIVRCCEGQLETQWSKIKPDVYVDSDNVVVVRRVVLLNGETVTMNIVVYQ